MLDKSAQKLTGDERVSLLAYLSPKDFTRPHPTIERIYKTFAIEATKEILEKEHNLTGVMDRMSQKIPRRAVALQLLWPRFDGGVTTKMNHLMKLPLLLNPEGGYVCKLLSANGMDDPFDNKVDTSLLRNTY